MNIHKNARLDIALGRALKHDVAEAADAIRDLVSKITLSRVENGGTRIDIEGRLNALLGEGTYPDGVSAVSGGRW